MLNIALVVGFNSDLEAQSIRASLEYFGARVVTYWIGRPKDFVGVLSGKNLFNDINYIIFAFMVKKEVCHGRVRRRSI